MPIPVVCAACQTKLVAPDAAAGKKVKCKNCQAVIPVPEPEESDFEFVDTAPKPVAAKPIAAKPVLAVAVPAKPKPAVVAPGEYHDEFAFDQAPKPKKKSKAAIVLDDDDDDEPKPSKKKKAALLDDEEDDEDEAPRKGQKGKRKPEKKKSNALMFVALGVVALMAIGAIGGAVWYFAIRGDQATAATKPGGATAPAKDPLAGWTKYDKPGFSVYFKDSVGAAVPQSVTQAGVKVEGLTAGAEPSSKHGFVMVMNELPPAAFAAILQNPGAAFDGGIRGMLRDGKLLSQKDITFEGHPGREVRLTQKDGSEGSCEWCWPTIASTSSASSNRGSPKPPRLTRPSSTT